MYNIIRFKCKNRIEQNRTAIAIYTSQHTSYIIRCGCNSPVILSRSHELDQRHAGGSSSSGSGSAVCRQLYTLSLASKAKSSCSPQLRLKSCQRYYMLQDTHNSTRMTGVSVCYGTTSSPPSHDTSITHALHLLHYTPVERIAGIIVYCSVINRISSASSTSCDLSTSIFSSSGGKIKLQRSEGARIAYSHGKHSDIIYRRVIIGSSSHQVRLGKSGIIQLGANTLRQEEKRSRVVVVEGIYKK